MSSRIIISCWRAAVLHAGRGAAASHGTVLWLAGVAVLDVCDELDEAGVVDLVLRAVQRRLTTPARLRAELAVRSRHRWRPLLVDLLQESAAGVASVLELRYLRSVERAHTLPRAERNQPEARKDRRGNEYRDVRYVEWDLLVELDGRVAHPEDQPSVPGRRPGGDHAPQARLDRLAHQMRPQLPLVSLIG